MSISRLCLAMAWLVLWSIPAPAADLTKIDRTIAKEPVYASKVPKYCLLVFGPEAKTRVWAVLDGDVLYVDRNANGDLTEPGERLELTKGTEKFLVPDVTEPDGRKHTCLHVTPVRGDRVHLYVRIDGKHSWWVGFGGQQPQLAARPKDAPIIHFDGPLTLGRFQPRTRGEAGRDLLSLGTPGLGDGTFAAANVAMIPKDVKLVADLEFPSKAPGGKPITTRIALDWGH